MKFIVYVLFIQLTYVAAAVQPSVPYLRKLLLDSRDDAKAAQTFYNVASTVDQSDPLLMGFRAMSHLILCQHSNNVFSKYKDFNAGKLLLEAALQKDPTNVELIYFRFTTQTNAPRMLNYYQNIDADKKLLLTYIESGSTNDKQLYQLVSKFLLSSATCTNEEKGKINKLNGR